MGLFTEQTFGEALKSLNFEYQCLLRDHNKDKARLMEMSSEADRLREEICFLKHKVQSEGMKDEKFQELMQSRDSYRDRWRKMDAECERLRKEIDDLKHKASHRIPYMDQCKRLATQCEQLRKQIEVLKHEVPCEDCKGGIHGKYCPTCKSWRGAGIRCLDCDAEHVVCPTCRGSGLKYFPADVVAPVITATFMEPSSGPFSEMLDRQARRVGLARAKLIDDAAIKWLKEDEHGCRDYRNLYMARWPSGCEELRVADHTRGVDHTVLLKLPPIIAGYDDIMGNVPTEEES